MKRSTWLQCFAVLVITAAVLCLPACPQEEGEGSLSSNSTKKLNLNGEPVVMEAWGEPEEDPRCLLGYELEDGTPFWDRYVVLYGGRIRNRNCAADPDTPCEKTGLHCHLYDMAKKYIWDDVENKIRPLQKRGIKVLMSLVPDGDGVAIGSLYRWPNETAYPWSANNNGEPYPFRDEVAQRFVKDVADELTRLQLDGVGYDEEYANGQGSGMKGLGEVYPSNDIYGTTSAGFEAAYRIGGENMFRFAWELQQEMPYTISQDVYEIRFGAYLPEKMPMYKLAPDKYTQGTTEGDKTVRITSVFDYSFHAYYGNFTAQSNNPMPNGRYGPVSIALSDVGTAPKPAATTSGIGAAMDSHLAGDYGIVMFYCFRSRNELKERFPDMFGGNPPEWYLSMISQTLFGQNTRYAGEDYPRMWYW
jgi:hypothetical protein